jgi:hypothetical protein
VHCRCAHSWAAHRNTTRVEDIAYCLMGIFRLNMPLLYGEGTRAFRRLQEEILRVSEDYTLFAWSPRLQEQDDYLFKSCASLGFLASSPSGFWHFRLGSTKILMKDCFSIFRRPNEHIPPQLTSRGLSVTLPLHLNKRVSCSDNAYYACLTLSKELDQDPRMICVTTRRPDAHVNRYVRDASAGVKVL